MSTTQNKSKFKIGDIVNDFTQNGALWGKYKILNVNKEDYKIEILYSLIAYSKKYQGYRIKDLDISGVLDMPSMKKETFNKELKKIVSE